MDFFLPRRPLSGFLALTVLQLCAAAPVQPSGTPPLPLAEIQPGMKGEVWTVFRGTEPEPFTVEVTGIAINSHYWRFRSQDSMGNLSAWTSFGANLDNAPPGTPADPDFIVNTAGNTAPNAPAAPGQFTTADVAIPTGSESGTTVRFKATLTDPNGDGVKLQVEVRPLATAFSNIQSGESALVASGSLASIDVGNLLEGSYHWQFRTVDGTGSATAWTPMGGNPDFIVPSAIVGTSSSRRPKLCGLLGIEALFVALLLRRRRK